MSRASWKPSLQNSLLSIHYCCENLLRKSSHSNANSPVAPLKLVAAKPLMPDAASRSGRTRAFECLQVQLKMR